MTTGLLGTRRAGDERAAATAWWTYAPAAVIATVLTVTVMVANWRGTDLAAQVFRADLFRRHGFVLWNAQWFGGHATLSYSVLSPMVSAAVGPVLLAGISGVAAAVMFASIVGREFGDRSRMASVWFAVGTAANVVVGRVPFALGLGLGLGAVWAMQRRRVGIAAVAALLTTLASPVAGVLLLVAVAAWALSARTRWIAGGLVASGVVVPLVAVMVLFPGDGVFPYEPWAFTFDMAVAAVFFVVAQREHPALRIGAVVYAVAALATFLAPTALGGNVSRFTQFFAGPALACVLWPRRKLVLAVLAVPLLCWQWVPAVETIASAQQATGGSREYFQPLVDAVLARGNQPGRIEVPVTVGHWESAYVADAVPLARGWERQLDLTYDHVFYDGTLDASSYQRWLADNAVEYVALPDTRLDDSSAAERDLLRGGLPYLEPLWHDQHWQLWRVEGYHGLVDGGATVIDQDVTGLTLRVIVPGDVTIRVRPSPHWRLDRPGCVDATADGWTRLQGLQVGVVRLTQQWLGSPCP
jgi:hypothetical protein